MRLLLPSVLFVAVIVQPMGTAVAQSVWDRVEDPQPRVGWLGAGDAPSVQSADEELSALQQDRGGRVVPHRTVPDIGEAAVSRRMESIHDEARQRYFYQGPEQAESFLIDEIDVRLNVSDRWMADREATRALFDAVVYLVRARLDLGDREGARQSMKRLVGTLPAHRPDERMVPPDVVQMWEEAIERMEAAGDAYLDVSRLNTDRDCRPTVNGAEATEERLAVRPGRSYLIEERCNGERQPRRWWVGARPGEKRPVFALDDDSGAEELEEVFEFWRKRRDLDVWVYVGPGRCGGDQQTACMAVRARGEASSLELREYDRERMMELVQRRLQ